MRAPNEIDFWRGFALITIFIDHVPGMLFESYTFKNAGISDAAELFVFLAGWSLRLLVDDPKRKLSPLRVVLRLEGRALTIFTAQIVITQIALAMTAAGALALENPLLLQWNNAAAVFEDPIEAHVGLVILTHQLGYFDILPLYVVLMAGAPLLVLADRVWAWLPLVISIAVYVATLGTGVNLPTWPTEGRWFFNPFAWQAVFAIGFIFADPGGPAAWLRKHRRGLRWVCAPVVLAGVIAIAVLNIAPDPLSLPEPRLFFMFDKTFVSPPRILHLLALVGLFNGAFGLVLRWVAPIARFFSMLGRNSLYVFCLGSLLSLGGQFTRFVLGGGIAVDTGVVFVGIVTMGITAWIVEWRERTRAS